MLIELWIDAATDACADPTVESPPIVPFGNQADHVGPLALRPRLATGLPFVAGTDNPLSGLPWVEGNTPRTRMQRVSCLPRRGLMPGGSGVGRVRVHRKGRASAGRQPVVGSSLAVGRKLGLSAS